MSLLPTPASAVRTQTVASGKRLFRQGDPAGAIFIVRAGRMRLERHLADGHTVTLYVAHAGETFSEAALFSPVYHCDAIAEEPSEIEVHPKTALLGALATDADAAMALMARFARQVIQLRSRLETRNIRSAPDRVLHFLRLIADERTRTATFERPLKEVAGEIGLTHEVFYRTLAQLTKSGVITRNGRTIVLND